MAERGEQPSHNAFIPAAVVSKAKHKIECITTWHDQFVVYTKNHQIRIYKKLAPRDVLNRTNGAETKRQSYPPSFKETDIVDCQKREIEQIVAVDAAKDNKNILICIANSYILVYSLPEFRIVTTLPKTKGCHLFALSRKSITGNKPLYLCVAVKKKLILYQWKDKEPWFAEQREFTTPEKVRTLVFAGRSLCVGYKNEYSLIRVGTGDPSTVFPCGKNKRPVSCVLPDRELLLGQDSMGICVGFDGKPTREAGIGWSEPPLDIGYFAPYVVAILPNSIEIRNMNTRTLTQRIQLKAGRMLCCDAQILAASPDNVISLIPVPVMQQLEDLVDRNNFEEALTLCDLVSETDFEREEVTREDKLSYIHTRYGYFLFNQGDYTGAMQQFQRSNVDPRQVLALFPRVVPDGQCVEAKKRHPVKINHIPSPKILLDALGALIPYLSHLRNQLQLKQAKKSNYLSSGLEEDDWKLESAGAGEMILRDLVDTVLLKSYLKFDPESVKSLLENENYCDIQTCDEILKAENKDLERVYLYRSRGNHRKALKLLKQLGDGDGDFRGTQETVSYLQDLAQYGEEFGNLVLECSTWVFSKCPPGKVCEDGLSIFIDFPPVRNALNQILSERRETSIKRSTVLGHLKEKSNRSTCIQYLETLIDKCGEEGSAFHNELIELYLQEIKRYIYPDGEDGKDEDSDEDERDQVYSRAREAPGPLGVLRKKLLDFLERSESYKATKMLPKFPRNNLLEERAILLRRIHRHEQALAIYAYKLRDTKMAERYCDTFYDEHAPHDDDVDPESVDHRNKDKLAAQEVYIHLLKVYLKTDREQPMIKPALELLRKRFDRIDGPKALELLPENTPISDVKEYFQAVLSFNSQKLRGNQIVKNLLRADNLQVQETVRGTRSATVMIEDDTQCPRCSKRIGNSAFARYPNGIVVHYICCDDKYICPVTNTNFGSPNV